SFNPASSRWSLLLAFLAFASKSSFQGLFFSRCSFFKVLSFLPLARLSLGVTGTIVYHEFFKLSTVFLPKFFWFF
ncbi:hypothetical protein, partial [Youxingia wuxianensis]|uniref:hypothetical protein n=1 Tax=Youxingia wuxianensis TaxID=2763678 RepID=UPI0021CD11DE